MRDPYVRTRECGPFDQTLSRACMKGAGHETRAGLSEMYQASFPGHTQLHAD